MAFDFPANPVLNQKFVSGSNSYVWNGYGWMSEPPTAYVKVAGDMMTGPLTIRMQGSSGHLKLDNTTATDPVGTMLLKNGVMRWFCGAGPGPEPGADVNTEFHFRRYNDAGTVFPDIPLKINRQTGRAQIAFAPVDPMDVANKAFVEATMGGGGPEHVLRAGDVMTGGLTLPTLTVSAAAGAQADVYSQLAGAYRWLVRMTDNFELHRYSDAGAYLGSPLQINRTTGNANFVGQVAAGSFWSANGYMSSFSADSANIGNCSSGGTFSLNVVNCGAFTASSITDYGVLTVNGAATFNSNLFVMGALYSYGQNIIMRGGGSNECWLHMNYNNDTPCTSMLSIDTFSPQHVGGTFSIRRGNDPNRSLTVYGSGSTWSSTGYNGKSGIYGGPEPNAWNFNWGSNQLHAWIDNTYLGAIAYQSDYRIKRNVVPLDSTWAQIKQLRPVRYNLQDYAQAVNPEQRDYSDPLITNNKVGIEVHESKVIPADQLLIKGDNVEHWGFIAHELQETLIEDAATGYKDAPEMLQSPNPWTIIAALTKTLQEAMTRIESLESRMRS